MKDSPQSHRSAQDDRNPCARLRTGAWPSCTLRMRSRRLLRGCAPAPLRESTWLGSLSGSLSTRRRRANGPRLRVIGVAGGFYCADCHVRRGGGLLARTSTSAQMQERRVSHPPLEPDVPAPGAEAAHTVPAKARWPRPGAANRAVVRKSECGEHVRVITGELALPSTCPPLGGNPAQAIADAIARGGRAGPRPIAERSGSGRESEGRRRLSLPSAGCRAEPASGGAGVAVVRMR
jgi:hypothetical protein